MDDDDKKILMDELLTLLPKHTYRWLALAGSACQMPTEHLHDIDFMIVADEGETFLNRFHEQMRARGREDRFHAIPSLSLHGWKTVIHGYPCSFHLASRRTLDAYLQQIEVPASYLLQLDGLHLNATTVYRTWLRETSFLAGDEDAFCAYQFQASPERIPESAREDIRKALQNDIAYFRELPEGAACGRHLLQMQMLVKLISLCYVENRAFYATLKYLDRDVQKFSKASAAVRLVQRMAQGESIWEELLLIGKEEPV